MPNKPPSLSTNDSNTSIPLSHTLSSYNKEKKLYLSPNLLLSYALIDSLCSYISQGLSLSDSFSLLGIAPSTHKRWFSLANKELSLREEGIYDSNNDIYLSLLFDTSAALSSYQLSLLSKLNSSKDSKASMFLLERVFKDRYSIQSNVKSESNVTLGGTGKLEIVIRDETDSERIAKLERDIVSERK